MKKSTGPKALMLSAASIALIATANAGAQEVEQPESNDNRLIQSKITVTAQRRDESIQEVPISVTALSGESLRELRIDSSRELVNQIPNFQVSTTFGNSGSLYQVRGISNPDYQATSNSPIPLYSDEVLVNSINAQGFALLDIGRVEVLRGPQGTLFGRNSSGGAIQIISKRPTSEPEGYIEGTVGSYGLRSVTAAASGALVESGKIRGRISGLAQDSNGHVKNLLIPGNKLGEDEKWAVRGLLEVDLSDRSMLTLKAQQGRIDGDAVIFHNVDALDPISYSFGGIFGPTPYPSPQGKETDYEKIFYPFDQYEYVDAQEFSAKFEHEFDGVKFKSISAYLLDERDVLAVEVSSLTDLLPDREQDQQWQVTQEFQVASDSSDRFQWIAGAFYLKQQVEGFRQTGFGSFDFIDNNTFDPVPDGILDTGFTSYLRYREDLESYAGYLHTDYQFTDKLKVTVAGRIGVDDRNLRNLELDSALVYDPLVLRFDDTDQMAPGAPQTTSAAKSWTMWNARLGLDYKVSDDLMVYGSISRGVKGGSFSTSIFDLSEFNTVDPETVLSYETGFRSEWFENKITFNGTAFFYKFDDFQEFIIESAGTGFIQILDNVPSVELWGGEIEIAARPTDNLFFNLGVGYTDSEYKEYLRGGVDLAGNERPIRKLNINGMVQYEFDLPGQLGYLRPQIDFNYRDSGFSDPENTIAYKLPSITTVNARLAYADITDTISLTAWVENISDERKIDQWSPDLIQSGFGSLTVVTLPRMWGVTLRKEF